MRVSREYMSKLLIEENLDLDQIIKFLKAEVEFHNNQVALFEKNNDTDNPIYKENKYLAKCKTETLECWESMRTYFKLVKRGIFPLINKL